MPEVNKQIPNTITIPYLFFTVSYLTVNSLKYVSSNCKDSCFNILYRFSSRKPVEMHVPIPIVAKIMVGIKYNDGSCLKKKYGTMDNAIRNKPKPIYLPIFC